MVQKQRDVLQLTVHRESQRRLGLGGFDRKAGVLIGGVERVCWEGCVGRGVLSEGVERGEFDREAGVLRGGCWKGCVEWVC